MKAAITGWGTAPPEGVLTNQELEARLDTNDDWITERTGIRERRYAGRGDSTSTFAIAAGAAAIKQAGLAAGDIDLMVMATTSPDQMIPHTGAFVSDGIGLRCGSFDLNAACAGFVYELVIGTAMVSTGNPRHVLVIGGETLSRVVDPADRGTSILFGDGAAAFVISPRPDRPLRRARLGPRLRRLAHQPPRGARGRHAPARHPRDRRCR